MTPPSSPLDRVAGAYDAAVLAEARRGEPVSRSELAAALDVTPQAVSKILSRLIERGLMAEAGSIVTGPGKPTTLYRIVPSSRRAIGVHVSREQLRCVGVDLTGEVIARHESAIDPAAGADALVAGIRSAVMDLARSLAQRERLLTWLTEHATEGTPLELAENGEVRSAAVLLERVEKAVERHRDRLGLSPLAAARLGKDVAAQQVSLAQVWAQMDETGTEGGS